MKKLFIILLAISANNYAYGIGYDALCDKDCRAAGIGDSKCMLVCTYETDVKSYDQACYTRLREMDFDEGFSKYRCRN